MSDKNSTKANFLLNFCQEKDISFICFDYTGHGESSGTISEGTISGWLEDSLDVIDNLTKGEIILIGSIYVLYTYSSKVKETFFSFAYLYNDSVRWRSSILNAEGISKDFTQTALLKNKNFPP